MFVRFTSGSMHCPASSMKIWVNHPLVIPIPCGVDADPQVDTMTRNCSKASRLATENWSRSSLKTMSFKAGGRCLGFRDGAFSLKRRVGPSSSSLSAITSAAPLEGAHARMRASGFWARTWRIASTMVTVFPVPGLRSKSQVRHREVSGKAKNTYGPKTTKGIEPGASFRIEVTA